MERERERESFSPERMEQELERRNSTKRNPKFTRRLCIHRRIHHSFDHRLASSFLPHFLFVCVLFCSAPADNRVRRLGRTIGIKSERGFVICIVIIHFLCHQFVYNTLISGQPFVGTKWTVVKATHFIHEPDHNKWVFRFRLQFYCYLWVWIWIGDVSFCCSLRSTWRVDLWFVKCQQSLESSQRWTTQFPFDFIRGFFFAGMGGGLGWD